VKTPIGELTIVTDGDAVVTIHFGRVGESRVPAGHKVLEQLEEYFAGKRKTLLEPKAIPDRIVFIVSQDECNYGKFVRVLDGAREAGAEMLGFATDPPEPSIFM